MNCKCGSTRIATVNAKCSDMCNVEIGSVEHNDYVPVDLGIGGGDYIRMKYCLDCGQMQGSFPLERSNIEMNNELDHTDD